VPGPRHRLLLIVNRLATIGGAEVQLTHLAKGLARAGHRVTLCCIDSSSLDPSVLADAGVELVELHARRRRQRALAIGRLTSLARRAEIVQCTMWDPSLWGRIAAILARRPVIVADHATDRAVQVSAGGASRARWIALHNRLLDRFTYATVACASSQRAVLEGEGVAAGKIVHIPNGVPVEELRRAAAAGGGRAALGLPEAVPLVIQVGLFRPEKNQAGALEALRATRERVPEARLVFVGDGVTRAEVEARATAIGAREWALFLGLRSDVAALMSVADLMLLPSSSDAMPMTVLEAMALGVPVLATDVGDVREILGEGGVCVPVDEPEALAEECARLLASPERLARLGEAGGKRSATFSAATMVRRYEALFDAASAGTSPLAAVAAAG